MARKKQEPRWEFGEVVIDANQQVWERGDGPCWWGLGMMDEPFPHDEPERPLRRLVPVAVDAPWLYRITYSNGKVKHGPGRVLGPVLGAMRNHWGYNHPVKIERAPDPAWEDVTAEHIHD